MKDDQRVLLTRRLLQEGLLRLLERKDIDSIHVSELCAESGINRATFYRHYSQPRDILTALRSSMIRDVRTLAEKDRAERNIHLWLEHICQYFFDHAQQLRILFKTRTDDDFVNLIRQLYTQQLPAFRSTPLGQQLDEQSLRLTAYGYAGGFYYILRQWILEPIDKTPRQIAQIMYNLMSPSKHS